IECLLRYVLSLLALCFLHATAPTEIYTLSLHDALPISSVGRGFTGELRQRLRLAIGDGPAGRAALEQRSIFLPELKGEPQKGARSEEHTSELQSRENLVCRLLLEKKKNKREKKTHNSSN